MNKTLSVSLNSQNFFIEEAAYNRLSEYLSAIRRHCGTGTSPDEVVADIEASIAEKFKTSLSQHKDIITSEDVEKVIRILGTVDDFDTVKNGLGDEADAVETPSRLKRKLYRDTDNALLAGVASGLGVYFDVDVVFVRILFIAFLFFGGSAIVVYVLLWIVVPEAKTTAQKLEMQGQSPTIAAFRNFAKAAGKGIQETLGARQSRKDDTYNKKRA